MFKKTTLIAAASAFLTISAHAEVKQLWSTGGFSNPESVYEDSKRGVLYVSNVNGTPLSKNGKGYISKVSTDGKIETLKWIEGLNAPKGMVIQGDKLFVSDIDQLIEIDLKAGKIANSYSAEGAIFLNDTAVAEDGTVYVSDIAKRKIWRLKEGKMSIWYDDDGLMHPNGLRIEGDTLFVAGWGRGMSNDGSTKVAGNIFTIDLKTKELKNLGSGAGVGNLDGLERDGSGNFLATDWVAGALYRIKEDGSHETLIDLRRGSADLEVSNGGKTAIIPMMMDGKVTAYSLD